MEVTLVILKPSAVQRGIMGEIISRFERKGIQIVGMKMIELSDEVLSEHYSHLSGKSFFGRVKEAMRASPVVVMALKGLDVINVVRRMAGVTNGRESNPGTIRGDYSMSMQENIVHASDSAETAQAELERFFAENEIFNYSHHLTPYLYAGDEI